jgi:hypothetical protein
LQKEFDMAVREAPPRPLPTPSSHYAPGRREDPYPEDPYPAVKARGGEIVLNTPTRRALFFAGLAGAVMLAVLVTVFSLAG